MKILRKVGKSAMLLSNKCSVVASIKVELTFDDNTSKERILSTGDLVSVDYNGGGLRKHVDGKIICISANGTDPNGWYIIVDGSDDFSAGIARFAPTSILNCEIIRKGDTIDIVQSPIGVENIGLIRSKNGYLQYSDDGGITWKEFKNCSHHHCDEIQPQEGTVPIGRPPMPHNDCGCHSTVNNTDDSIEDAVYL
jgi:hypothetical protein